MNTFSVPTVAVDVRIWCTGGRTFTGRIFVPRMSPLHGGVMRVDEWLNLAPDFFPFTPGEARERTLLQKSDIVSITVDEEPDENEEHFPTALLRVQADGYRVEGTVVIDMPPHSQRVVDFLNRPDRFFTVHDGAQKHIVHKARVTRVCEIEEE